MLYALNTAGKKIKASKDIIGYCPECYKPMIPRCGRRKIWHWAHKGKHNKNIGISLFNF